MEREEERLIDGDPVALEERIRRVVEQDGSCDVSRFTYWYTGRPPVHEALVVHRRAA